MILGAHESVAGGLHLAFERSQAEYFLLLNPDAVIAPQDLARLVDALRGDARLGAVSPRTWWNMERSFLLPLPLPQTPCRSLAHNLAWCSRTLTRDSGHCLRSA